MDPIAIIVQFIGHVLTEMPPMMRLAVLMWGALGVLAIAMTLRPNFMGKDSHQEEKKWDTICGSLIDRIHNLMPQYQETLQLYGTNLLSVLQKNPNVIKLAQTLQDSIKQTAETDFCAQDAHKDSHAVLLAEQFKDYLNQPMEEN